MSQNRTDKTIGRRVFLKASALVGFLTAIPGIAWAFFIERLEVRTVEEEDFRFDAKSGTIKWKGRKEEPYYLQVGGLVGKPLNISYKELLSFPQSTQAADFHCVEGWSVRDIKWGGFRFEEIVKRVHPKSEARYVIFHSLGRTQSKPHGLDHYRESLPLQDLLDTRKRCLLALSMDGRLLTHDHGAPLRVVSPLDLGYKGAKFVARIEFAREGEPGWWTLANPVYTSEAPVPPERLRSGK